MTPLLEIRDLVKHFPIEGGRAVQAVNGISLDIAAGEALALVGESGSGKTTAGRCILRVIEPSAGSIRFHGENIAAMEERTFRRYRPRIQMVFQEPYDSLPPRMRIGRIIDEPLWLAGKLAPSARHDRVLEVLEMVRLGGRVADKYPHELSAGEQQRVGIARALATEPELVVLDEPTSALDVSVRAEILDLLSELQERLRLSYLFISHDLTAVRRVCHRVAIMYLGKVVEIGRTEQVFNQPRHPYSKALLSSVLYPDPNERPARFLLAGEIPSPINLPVGCHLYSRCPWAVASCERAYPPFEAYGPDRYVSCFRAREMATDSAAARTPIDS